jgi:hypothetical protein
LWLAEAAIGVLVLDQTYRKTVLRVGGEEMRLVLRGLFSGERRHAWSIAEIGALRVESTQAIVGAPPLAELQIHPSHDLCVHLFTDHHEDQVKQIANIIAWAMKGEHPLPAASEPAVAVPDEATFNRLLGRTRTLRDSDRARRLP